MKILIVGPDTPTKSWFYETLRKAYPDEEIVRQDELPNLGAERRVTGLWVGEVSALVLTRPEESLPKPSRRKKR